MTADIAIGICTYRRDGIAETLASIGAQTVAPSHVVVADNDETDAARARIEAAAARAGVPLTYIHAPARNIATARNAILTACPARYLAWIDDDETAAPDWLERLRAAMQPGIAAVFGPSLARYPEDAPDWMRAARPHDQRPARRGGRVLGGHTANALVDLADPAFANLHFDPAFGPRGGSDGVYFRAALARGARFAFTEDAQVHETVPPERLTMGWLRRRYRRNGEAYGASAPGSGLPLFLSGSAKAAAFTLQAHFSPDWATRHRAQLRAAFHAGVAREQVGARLGAWYGRDSG